MLVGNSSRLLISYRETTTHIEGGVCVCYPALGVIRKWEAERDRQLVLK